MKKKFIITIALVLLMLLSFTGLALAFDSGGNPGVKGPNTIEWTGQGADDDGVLDTEYCPSPDAVPDGIDPNSYLLWIFTTDGGEATAGQIHLGGSGSGEYAWATNPGGSFHFFTPYFTPDSNLTAYVDFNVADPGNGAWILTISHGCPGEKDYEELTVSKTVETSFTRVHSWDIAKMVETENGYTHDGFPKVWLYIDGHGNEQATWTVDVSYLGYEDGGHKVSGVITIENTGTLDAVITNIEDVMGLSAFVVNGVNTTAIYPNVTCDADPIDGKYALAVGQTLTCNYSYDGNAQGVNTVTVTTERDTYSATAAIVWGAPTTEVNKTVTVKDISDLFGEVVLGTVTAPNDGQFTYTKDFAWADYGADLCGDYVYDNTASIVETGQSASAKLKVNVQCYVYETAYAKGNPGLCFIPDFSNWGWTNLIKQSLSSYTWDLWAGAGQCDTSKGTLVGSVTVDYARDGYVAVTYNVGSPYLIKETHVYVGIKKYPQVLQGKKWVSTVAPGSYYNNSPFTSLNDVYVIAHAVVGLPDPNFGP